MDLEAWRRREGLSYPDLADLIGEGGSHSARRHALGITWPPPERIEKILTVTRGEVTIEAMHARHLSCRRAERGFAPQRAAAE